MVAIQEETNLGCTINTKGAIVSYSVFTGDLVDSSSLKPAELTQALDTLFTAFRTIVNWAGAGRYTTHRGDGWQLVAPQEQYALRYALFIRASLKAAHPSFDTRIAVATGHGDIPDDITTATAPAFIASGRSLDAMHYQFRMAYSQSPEHAAIAILLDTIAQDWTSTQAETLLPFLDPTANPTQKDVAHHFGKSRQAISKILDAAHYAVIKETLNLIEGAPSHA